jgi:hypothetical protein
MRGVFIGLGHVRHSAQMVTVGFAGDGGTTFSVVAFFPFGHNAFGSAVLPQAPE